MKRGYCEKSNGELIPFKIGRLVLTKQEGGYCTDCADFEDKDCWVESEDQLMEDGRAWCLKHAKQKVKMEKAGWVRYPHRLDRDTLNFKEDVGLIISLIGSQCYEISSADHDDRI